MSAPAGRAELDYLARLNGFEGGVSEIQERMREEREAERKAELEAKERARAEEERRRILAEDLEISTALESERMIIEINGHPYDAKRHEDLTCPECGKLPSFMRETSLFCIWRATFRGELRKPHFYRSVADLRYDMIPAGESSDGLRVLAPSNIYEGRTKCSECGAELNVRIEVDCVHDGQPVRGLRKRE